MADADYGRQFRAAAVISLYFSDARWLHRLPVGVKRPGGHRANSVGSLPPSLPISATALPAGVRREALQGASELPRRRAATLVELGPSPSGGLRILAHVEIDRIIYVPRGAALLAASRENSSTLSIDTPLKATRAWGRGSRSGPTIARAVNTSTPGYCGRLQGSPAVHGTLWFPARSFLSFCHACQVSCITGCPTAA